MDEAISQLKKYLQSNNDNVLLQATELCKGQHIPALIPELLKLTSHNNAKIADNSLLSLISMTSDHPEAIRQLIALGAVTRLLDSVIAATPNNVGHRLMLLTNITTEQTGTAQLLDLHDKDLKGQRLLRLAIRFASPPEDLEIPQTELINGLPIMASTTVGDEYEYAAMVLMNATLIKEGREIFYETPKFFMPSFLEALSSRNTIRKQGIAGVIRNLCFDSSKHEFLLKEAKILPHIIRPLVPKEIEDNLTAYEMLQNAFPGISFPGIEPVASNRRNLLETLWLLCQSEVGKEELTNHHVVFVMREVESLETDEENRNLSLRIGAILLGPDELPTPEEAAKLAKEMVGQDTELD